MSIYKVSLWPGFGAELQSVVVKAGNEEDALVQASMKIGFIVPAAEADEDVTEHEDLFTYLDRTEYNDGCIYLLTENAVVEIFAPLLKDTIYETLCENNVPESDIDHHYSDLYIRSTAQTIEILKAFYEGKKLPMPKTFRSNIEGDGIWFECPFQYTPHFNGQAK
jgi:hypothetical protein